MTYLQTIEDMPAKDFIIHTTTDDLEYAEAKHTFNIDGANFHISAKLNLFPVRREKGEPQEFLIKTSSVISMDGHDTQLTQEQETQVLNALSKYLIFDVQYTD